MITKWWIRINARLDAIFHGDAEEGQGLVEYTLILAFIAIFVVVQAKRHDCKYDGTLINCVLGKGGTPTAETPPPPPPPPAETPAPAAPPAQ